MVRLKINNVVQKESSTPFPSIDVDDLLKEMVTSIIKYGLSEDVSETVKPYSLTQMVPVVSITVKSEELF